MSGRDGVASFAGILTGAVIGAGIAFAVGPRLGSARKAAAAMGDRLAEAAEEAKSAAAAERAALGQRHLGEQTETE